MKKLTKRQRYALAKKHIYGIEERGDLETHNSDSEDFFEISVWELVDIIDAAYEFGQKNILKTLDKK